MDAERRGDAFVVFRDAGSEQVIVGLSPPSDETDGRASRRQ
jgi:hypothetical protein